MTKITAASAPSRRSVLKVAGAAAAAIATPAFIGVRAAYADYPDRPVKFVVANTPGGPSDTTMRISTKNLAANLGQAVVIENVPGAGGRVGRGGTGAGRGRGFLVLALDHELGEPGGVAARERGGDVHGGGVRGLGGGGADRGMGLAGVGAGPGTAGAGGGGVRGGGDHGGEWTTRLGQGRCRGQAG